MWRDLYARADATAFLGWEWMSAWIAGLDAMPFILVGEAGGALVLLGLLAPHRRREALGAVQVDGLWLHATGRDEADVIAVEYNGFLVDRAWAGRAETAAIGWLLGRTAAGRRFDEVQIKAIAEDRAALYAPAGALVRTLGRKPSWQVDLAAVRAAGGVYLDALSANTRQQVRRSMRLYASAGSLEAARAPDAEMALAWLDELAALHQAQWRARGKPGGWAFPFFERFQRRLVAAAVPAGTAEIVRISAGAETIGYVYNLIGGDHVLAFVTGFRIESDKRLKPGLVGHALCIQRHVDEGRRLYDFLAGDYRYKASLGRPGPDFLHLQVQRATPMTRFEGALRLVWENGRAGLERLARRR